MNPEQALHAWTLSPDPTALCPATLRLARAVPDAHATLAAILSDPLDRALAGLGPAPDWREEADLGRAVLAAVAAADADDLAPDEQALAGLEARARGSLQWWVPAARLHASVSLRREAEIRRALSNQNLPFVMPGELHPLLVDLLAAGERVLPALHVDWNRKLTAFAVESLALDARALGLWFWPLLPVLDAGRLGRALARLPEARRLPPGARGLTAAYRYRVGGDWASALDEATPRDHLLAALAMLGDRAG